MSHTRDHIIIQKVRALIAAWPLSSTGGIGAAMFALGWWLF